MEVTKFLNPEKEGGFTHKVKITHADLTETTVNTAQTIEMITVAKGTYVDAAAFNLVTPFKDASDAALNTTTLIIGDSSSTARYSASKELNENGTEILAWAEPGSNDTAPYCYLAADTVDAVFGSMAAKALNDVDTGRVDIFLRVVDLAAK